MTASPPAISWTFNPLRPGDKTREAVQGEFFATTAIRTEAEALVREAIQNSLDAGQGGAVHVRIHVSGKKGALPAARAGAWLRGAWRHFAAEGNGLCDAPAQIDPCPFLVIEDFGTSGLEGDPEVHFVPEGAENPFYHFFRAEGRSGKTAAERGRWGIGKFVFPRSSRLRCFFGLSVRGSDGAPALMGEAILRSHKLLDTPYHPDGWYGVRRESGIILPASDPNLLKRFREDFALQRQNEPGLSIVVPYCSPEMDRSKIIEALLRSYFYPILSRDLSVEVSDPSSVLVLDDQSLPRVVDLFANLKEELGATVSLARSATEGLVPVVFPAPPPNRAAKWSDDLAPSGAPADLRATLSAGEPAAVRPQVTVRRRSGGADLAKFDVFLSRDEAATARPIFIREGIIISDVRAPRCRGYRALVVINEGPLGDLLGDAENPSHTQWQTDSSHFKNRYIYGPAVLRFVSESVANLLRIIHGEGQEEDVTALLDIFSLPVPQDEGGIVRKKRRSPRPGQDEATPPEVPPIPRPPRRYRVQRSGGGFRVHKGDAEAELPAVLDIRVAYDRRRGSSLKNYSKGDFRLDRNPIVMEPPPHGIEVLERAENRLVVRILDDDFHLTVTGFDERRDLYVDVRPRGSFDG